MSEASSRLRTPWCLLVMVVALVLTLPSLGFEFVQDDHILIVENPAVGGWRGVRDALTRDYFSRPGSQARLGYYRPLTRLSLVLDHALFKTHPTGYHATNVVWGLLAVAAACASMARWGVPAALAALLFAAHPVRAASVGMVTARADLMATCFSLLAARSWLGGQRRAWAWAGAWAFLAFCGKEAALPLALVLGSWSAMGIEGTPPPRRASTWVYLGFPLLSYALVRAALGVSPPPMPSGTTGVLLASMGRTLASSARALLLPIRLPFAPLVPQPDPSWALVVLAFPLLLVCCVSRKVPSWLRLGISWSALFLLPVSLPPVLRIPSVPGYLAWGPRLLVLPAAGVCVVQAGLLSLLNRWVGRRATVLLGLSLAAVWAGEFLHQLRTVANEQTILRAVVQDRAAIPPARRSPSYQAQLLTLQAQVWWQENHLPEALSCFLEASRLDTNNFSAHLGVAITSHLLGSDSLALARLQRILPPDQLERWDFEDFTRNYLTGVRLLVEILVRHGAAREAVTWAARGVDLFPASWRAHQILAWAHQAAGDTGLAAARDSAVRLGAMATPGDGGSPTLAPGNAGP